MTENQLHPESDALPESDPLAAIPEPYRSAHKASYRSREQLMASKWVGCFYCCMIYKPRSIKEWIDDGQTAMCPACDIDSVLPISAEQFDSDFLEKMHKYWFAAGPSIKLVKQ